MGQEFVGGGVRVFVGLLVPLGCRRVCGSTWPGCPPRARLPPRQQMPPPLALDIAGAALLFEIPNLLVAPVPWS